MLCLPNSDKKAPKMVGSPAHATGHLHAVVVASDGDSRGVLALIYLYHRPRELLQRLDGLAALAYYSTDHALWARNSLRRLQRACAA